MHSKYNLEWRPETKFQVLDCTPDDVTCIPHLLKRVEKYVDKNVLILLLNSDVSMLNIPKRKFLLSMLTQEAKIIVSHLNSLGNLGAGLQLVAEARALKGFLEVKIIISFLLNYLTQYNKTVRWPCLILYYFIFSFVVGGCNMPIQPLFTRIF